jgi:hypothetical protein
MQQIITLAQISDWAQRQTSPDYGQMAKPATLAKWKTVPCAACFLLPPDTVYLHQRILDTSLHCSIWQAGATVASKKHTSNLHQQNIQDFTASAHDDQPHHQLEPSR